MFTFLKSLFSSTSGFDLASVIRQGAFLVDVLTASEFKGGHVKGSINIPLDRILDNIDKFKGENTL